MSNQISFNNNVLTDFIAPEFQLLYISDISKDVEISSCSFSNCHVKLILFISSANNVECAKNCYEGNNVESGSYSINERAGGVLYGSMNTTMEYNSLCYCSGSSGAIYKFIMSNCNFTKITATSDQYRSGYCISNTNGETHINYISVEKTSGSYFFAFHYTQNNIAISNFVGTNNDVVKGWFQNEGITSQQIDFIDSIFKNIQGTGNVIITGVTINFNNCGAENNNQNFGGQTVLSDFTVGVKYGLCDTHRIFQPSYFNEQKSFIIVALFIACGSELNF